MTLLLPCARSSVAAVSKSARGAWAASSRAASRVMDWSAVCICERAGVRKEFNTEDAENAEFTEKRGSTKQVFSGGADDAGGGFGGGLEAVAADQDDGGAFGFAHQEAGGGCELVGDSENGGGERFAVAIASAAQIMEDGDA